MLKLFVMDIASRLTVAACGSAPEPVSPDLSDPQARAKNLEVWETFRAYYAAVDAALADDKDWPEPAVNVAAFVEKIAGAAVPALTAALGPLLASGGKLAGLAAMIGPATVALKGAASSQVTAARVAAMIGPTAVKTPPKPAPPSPPLKLPVAPLPAAPPK